MYSTHIVTNIMDKSFHIHLNLFEYFFCIARSIQSELKGDYHH